MTNPFAPTPLGKDWTPPTPPDPPTEEIEALGDLFEETSAATPQQAVTGGLGDLFATPHDTSSNDQADDAGGGLGDLFRQDTPEPVQTVEPAAGPNTATLKPRVKRRGLVGTVSSTDTGSSQAALATEEKTSNKNDRASETTTETAAGAATWAEEARTGTQGEDAPKAAGNTMSTAGTSASPEAAAQSRAKAAQQPREQSNEQRHGTRDGAQQTGRWGTTTRAQQPARAPRKNAQENDRIWTLVDQTLALIGSDSMLQRLAQSIELTQNLDIYSRQRGELEAALRPRMASSGVTISGPADIEKIIARVHDELSGISVLGDLWRDPSVDEILVDRWDVVNVERNGRLETTDVSFRSHQHAEGTARSLALKISDRAVSRSIPLVTAELPGARVTFAFGAVVKGGLSVTIRKFKKLLELSDLLRFGSLNEEIVDFLRDAVLARGSILVSGGTGTGKTTIINLLSTFIPDEERVISIEDAFELKLANTHVVSLQTKEAASSDDTVSVTLANLLRNTLRMRPDRIIVGEIREGEGAMVMLAAANTGHDGTITTIHANSVTAALNERFPDLVRQVRSNRDDDAIQRSIAGAFDLAIQITRGRSGRRYVSEIAVICGVDWDTGRIETETVFSGEENAEGVRFQRHPVRSETEFVRRLEERSGGRWTS